MSHVGLLGWQTAILKPIHVYLLCNFTSPEFHEANQHDKPPRLEQSTEDSWFPWFPMRPVQFAPNIMMATLV